MYYNREQCFPLELPVSAANSNNTISGCTLYAAQHGIFINGFTGTNDQNWVISNNSIGSLNIPEKIGVRGITMQA